MDLAILAITGVAGLVAGMFLGLFAGQAVKSHSLWVLWSARAGLVIAGVFLTLLGQGIDSLHVAVLGVGLTGGGLTGLKYGSGKVRFARKVDR